MGIGSADVNKVSDNIGSEIPYQRLICNHRLALWPVPNQN
jgi:hypothetical protein